MYSFPRVVKMGEELQEGFYTIPTRPRVRMYTELSVANREATGEGRKESCVCRSLNRKQLCALNQIHGWSGHIKPDMGFLKKI